MYLKLKIKKWFIQPHARIMIFKRKTKSMFDKLIWVTINWTTLVEFTKPWNNNYCYSFKAFFFINHETSQLEYNNITIAYRNRQRPIKAVTIYKYKYTSVLVNKIQSVKCVFKVNFFEDKCLLFFFIQFKLRKLNRKWTYTIYSYY